MFTDKKRNCEVYYTATQKEMKNRSYCSAPCNVTIISIELLIKVSQSVSLSVCLSVCMQLMITTALRFGTARTITVID